MNGKIKHEFIYGILIIINILIIPYIYMLILFSIAMDSWVWVYLSWEEYLGLTIPQKIFSYFVLPIIFFLEIFFYFKGWKLRFYCKFHLWFIAIGFALLALSDYLFY